MTHKLHLIVNFVVCEKPLQSEDDIAESYIHGCGKSEDMEFRPNYKYYEDIRDIRREKEVVLRLRQSPGIKRRREKAKASSHKTPTVNIKLLSEERTNYNSFA